LQVLELSSPPGDSVIARMAGSMVHLNLHKQLCSCFIFCSLHHWALVDYAGVILSIMVAKQMWA